MESYGLRTCGWSQIDLSQVGSARGVQCERIGQQEGSHRAVGLHPRLVEDVHVGAEPTRTVWIDS